MTFSVVIPARYASQRLPGKPLVDLQGMTMIERVYHQASKSAASKVIVATDHAEIEACVQAFGGEVCMTREDHESGTDRLAEVANNYGFSDDDIVVNVQGDEPLIPPEVINQVAENLQQNTQASVATVSEKIEDLDTYLNPNAVKVVADNTGLALYFSRASIPWNRDLLADSTNNKALISEFLSANAEVQKHVGIYAYRVSLLNAFAYWEPTSLEKIEKLEQLRIMAYGHRIHVQEACLPVPGGIDTPEDLEKVRALLPGLASGLAPGLESDLPSDK